MLPAAERGPGPSSRASLVAHPRCLRGGVAWLRRVVCKHLTMRAHFFWHIITVNLFGLSPRFATPFIAVAIRSHAEPFDFPASAAISSRSRRVLSSPQPMIASPGLAGAGVGRQLAAGKQNRAGPTQQAAGPMYSRLGRGQRRPRSAAPCAAGVAAGVRRAATLPPRGPSSSDPLAERAGRAGGAAGRPGRQLPNAGRREVAPGRVFVGTRRRHRTSSIDRSRPYLTFLRAHGRDRSCGMLPFEMPVPRGSHGASSALSSRKPTGTVRRLGLSPGGGGKRGWGWARGWAFSPGPPSSRASRRRPPPRSAEPDSSPQHAMSRDLEKELNVLRKQPANKVCPNCSTEDKFGFKNACVKYNTFVCSNCKAAHQVHGPVRDAVARSA